jgi:hypothetical protein
MFMFCFCCKCQHYHFTLDYLLRTILNLGHSIFGSHFNNTNKEIRIRLSKRIICSMVPREKL